MIVVTDGSKIGKAAFARICGIERVHDLITDTGAPADALARSPPPASPSPPCDAVRSPGLEPAPLDPALRDLPLRAYRPRASVRLPRHLVPRARFPAVDAHNHLGRWLTPDGGWAGPRRGCLARRHGRVQRGRDREPGRPVGRRARGEPRPLRPGASGPIRDVLPSGLGERSANRAGPTGSWRSFARRPPRARWAIKVWKDLGLGLRDEHRRTAAPG